MRKIIDEKGRLFGVLSIIDIIVILVIIVLTVGAYFRFFVMDETAVNVQQDTIKYTVLADDCRSYVGDSLKPGDLLYDSKNNSAIGTVTDVRVSEAQVDATDLHGNYLKADSEDKYRVEIDVECPGVLGSDGRYTLNRTYELSTGYQTEFSTKYVFFSGIFYSIEGQN